MPIKSIQDRASSTGSEPFHTVFVFSHTSKLCLVLSHFYEMGLFPSCSFSDDSKQTSTQSSIIKIEACTGRCKEKQAVKMSNDVHKVHKEHARLHKIALQSVELFDSGTTSWHLKLPVASL